MPRILHMGGLRDGASRRLFIATPMTGSPEPEYLHSMLQTQIALIAAGIEMDWMALIGDCHVDDARNFLVREFLEGDCTDLLFIDADEGWSGVELARLAQHDCDVIAGVLPRKADDDQGYPVRMFPGPIKTDNRGLIEVEGVGTGFMKIRRSVLERMYDAEPRKHRDSAKEAREHQIAIIFEREYIGGLRLSGDYAFCRKWRAIGGKIFIDPNMGFAHIGTKMWTGHLGHYLCERDNVLTPMFCAAFARIKAGQGKYADFEQVYAEWNNSYAIDPLAGAALYQIAATTEGVILETGSGLSTLLFAAAGAKVFALEHELPWVRKMRAAIDQLNLQEQIKLHYAPLREQKDGTIWYGLTTEIPDRVGLIFCDGPQRHYGREGVFDILGHYSSVPFIFDDANDDEWRPQIEAWARRQNRDISIIGEGRKLAVVAPLVELLQAAE